MTFSRDWFLILFLIYLIKEIQSLPVGGTATDPMAQVDDLFEWLIGDLTNGTFDPNQIRRVGSNRQNDDEDSSESSESSRLEQPAFFGIRLAGNILALLGSAATADVPGILLNSIGIANDESVGTRVKDFVCFITNGTGSLPIIPTLPSLHDLKVPLPSLHDLKVILPQVELPQVELPKLQLPAEAIKDKVSDVVGNVKDKVSGVEDGVMGHGSAVSSSVGDFGSRVTNSVGGGLGGISAHIGLVAEMGLERLRQRIKSGEGGLDGQGHTPSNDKLPEESAQPSNSNAFIGSSQPQTISLGGISWGSDPAYSQVDTFSQSLQNEPVVGQGVVIQQNNVPSTQSYQSQNQRVVQNTHNLYNIESPEDGDDEDEDHEDR